MNSRSALIVEDQEAAESSSFAWCNRQWLSSQALTRRSSVRPKQAVFNHNLLWLPESNGYPLELNDDPALHPWCSLLNRRTPPRSRSFHIRGGGETVARRRTFEWFGVLPLMPEHWTCRDPNRLSSYREFRNDYRSSAD